MIRCSFGFLVFVLLFVIPVESFPFNRAFNNNNDIPSDSLGGFTKRIHKVMPGDWLSKIAYHYYGDALKWGVIYKSNADKIKDPNFIYPGQEFYVPFVQPADTTANIIAGKTGTPVEEIKAPLRLEDIEFQGFIVDETQSKWGKEFYESYHNLMQSGIEATNYTIVISEKPMPRLGTQVSIFVNDTEIFQQYLQPREEFIEEIARYGAEYTKNYIANNEAVEKNPLGEDLKGSGIF